jgi:DNA-binding SARP family transcriptional activator
VEFRLLGPVEAWTGPRQLHIGPRKQRLALALLALEVNRPVDVDRLVALTWPYPPPRTARHAIHVGVSRLRAALVEAGGDDAHIVTRGSTYALHADPMLVDVHRFRSLVAAAHNGIDDLGRKVHALRDAIALWRGPPLADVAGPRVDQLCRGLVEARLTAWEDYLDGEVRLGRHNAVIGPLVDLVAEHPDRQRLVGLLMLALYRNGRPQEALRSYRILRGQLAAEFGLDPNAELQDLQGAILRSDASLDLPRPYFGDTRALARGA